MISLNAVDREFLTDYISKEDNKVDNVVSIVDYMLQKPDACMTAEGVQFEAAMKPAKMIQPVLMDDEIGKIGGQLVAGLIVAIIARDNKTVRPVNLDVLGEYNIPDLTQTSVEKIQTVLLPDIKAHFLGMESKGKGRTYMSEIFSYLRGLAPNAFFAIQHKICTVLFAKCFTWKYWELVQDKETGKKRALLHTKPVKGSVPVIQSVREEYKGSFTQLTSDFESVGEFLSKTKLKGPFFVWTKGLPTKDKIDHIPLDSFALANKHLQFSRSFRGSDDSGLSAWTSSFLACPGYTKEHLSICRALSLILGVATYGPVYVYGTTEDFRVKLCANLDARHKNGIFFVVDKNSYSTSVNSARYVLAEPPLLQPSEEPVQVVPLKKGQKKPPYVPPTFERRTAVYVIDAPADSAKEDDWKKVDGVATKRIEQYFGKNVQRIALLTHVQSDVWFKPSYKLKVGSPTSLHGMYCVVANFDVQFAAAEYWGAPLTYVPMKVHDRASFLQYVLAHNMSRNLSFLFPGYYCNPKMNLLMRPVKPKLPFGKVEVEEAAEVDKDFVKFNKEKGDEIEEVDYDSDDSDDFVNAELDETDEIVSKIAQEMEGFDEEFESEAPQKNVNSSKVAKKGDGPIKKVPAKKKKAPPPPSSSDDDDYDQEEEEEEEEIPLGKKKKEKKEEQKKPIPICDTTD